MEQPIAQEHKKTTKAEYNKLWRQNNKDKTREQARRHYLKKISEDPEYRQMLNERVKARNKLLHGAKPKGRPRTVFTNEQTN